MFAEIMSMAIAMALAALPLAFPARSASFYAIWVLCICILYLISLCVRLHRRAASLQKELDSTKQHHRAVSARFDEKRLDLARHQAALQSIEVAVLVATQSSNKNKLSILYGELQRIKINMNELGGNEK